MMIKINLLPVRQAAKRESGRQFLVAGLMLIAMTGAANYYWFLTRDAERQRKQDLVNQTQQRITELDKVIGEVTKLNTRRKEVLDKLSILDKLRKQRAGPVRMLDALASSIPKKVSLDTFTEISSAARIAGSGESHEDVSEFMKALSNVVWTPKGMGRVVERKRDATSVRIELLSGEGAMEDFPLSEVSYFFTNVELKGSIASSTTPGARSVRFDITMMANYAI
ncbi:MAG: PilN domain-containing protein [Archangium sp.]|nr:PilN domain-containing protein [Archangium sp.]